MWVGRLAKSRNQKDRTFSELVVFYVSEPLCQAHDPMHNAEAFIRHSIDNTANILFS